MKTTRPAGFALLLLAFFSLGNVFAAAKKETRPNVVFILMDDMGWADTGATGSKFYQTPNLDRLASEGVRFTSAYASCAVCSPTRAAVLTGKAPARLHLTDWIAGEGTPKQSRFTVPDWTKKLPLEEVTLAEAFKKMGYATAHLGKWHLGGEGFEPEKQGYDLNLGGGHVGHPASYFWPYGAKGASHRVPHLAERGGQEGEYLTDRLTEEALTYITAHKDHPFFLQLWHYAVHGPLMAKKELIEKSQSQGTPANGQANHTYAAMMDSVDQGVGRILAKLKELGLEENTIVVFTSDNGGVVHAGNPVTTSNAPLRKGKGFAYEGGLRVPLFVRFPGVAKAGLVTDAPVISTDFFATLMDLAQAPSGAAATALDGASFAPILRGEKLPERDLCWHYPHYWNGKGVTPYSVIRSGGWKLVRFYETGREELYRVSEDISETNDLAATKPEKVRELSGRLDAWLKSVGAQMPVPRDGAKTK